MLLLLLLRPCSRSCAKVCEQACGALFYLAHSPENQVRGALLDDKRGGIALTRACHAPRVSWLARAASRLWLASSTDTRKRPLCS